MAQTAVDILMESIYGKDFRLKVSDGVLNMYQIAIEIEKKQIMEAYIGFDSDSVWIPRSKIKDAEQYYNETYGTVNSNEVSD